MQIVTANAEFLKKTVTGSELAVDMLMKNKDEIKISDIYISVAGSSMVLSKSVILLTY